MSTKDTTLDISHDYEPTLRTVLMFSKHGFNIDF